MRAAAEAFFSYLQNDKIILTFIVAYFGWHSVHYGSVFAMDACKMALGGLLVLIKQEANRFLSNKPTE